jgi:predicted MPP superfamily phosphohydrolase
MFKYQLISDIHLEKYEEINYKDLIKPIEPILFLAGDIGYIKNKLYKNFMDYVSNNWEVVYVVLGNHEFYIEDDKNIYTYEELYDMYENLILEYANVILVTEGYEYKINLKYTNGKNIYIIGGVGFPMLDTNVDECYYNSNIYYKEKLNDFNFIYKNKSEKIDVEYFNNLSINSKTLLIESIHELSKLEEEYSIILLTHFPYGIHSLTSSSKYHNDDTIIKKYFCNNINNEINRIIINSAKLLIAGHTHHSYDFIYNDAKYVSNQLGYKKENNLNPLNVFEFE